MRFDFVDKAKAIQLEAEYKKIAFDTAAKYDQLPGFCNEPECRVYMAVLFIITHLAEGESCLFIDSEPAYFITDFQLAGGNAISLFCGRFMQNAFYENGYLNISYVDGVINKYKFIEEVNAWKHAGNNVSVFAAAPSTN